MKKALRDALDQRGYDTLTPVQTAVLDPDLEGKDLLVSAQTGSGKTLGFGLAIAPTLLDAAEAFGSADAPLALVIAPTRELAMQVKRELTWLFEGAGAQLASCVGGMDMRDERRALGRGAHIVVATPGRLRDHIMRGSIDLSELRAVVLDEADEMLDLGFREDLEFILGESPETRQTLMFSATVPKSISALATRYQKDAVRVIAKSENSQHADIAYLAMNVAERDTENAVINTLLYHRAPNAIVFANTRAMVNRMTTRLSNRGFNVVALSGELSQSERTHALQAMRDGRAQVCVATDVAARGIDLPNLDLVVHAELPNSHETLLHRSGRTGRAGRKGVSALVVTGKNRRKAERILGQAKLNAEWTPAPSADAVQAREEDRMFADPTWTTDLAEAETDITTRLADTFSAQQLAVAYLRLYRSVRSAPEELSDPGAKPAPRAPFGPSVWFAVTGGRQAGAEPRRLLPMLCKASGLDRDDIGAIRIQNDRSVVEVRETSVAAMLKAIGPDMMLEPGSIINQLAQAPDLGKSPARGPKPGGGSGGKYGAKTGSNSGPKSGANSGANFGAKPGARPKPKPGPRAAEKPAYRPKDDVKDKPKAKAAPDTAPKPSPKPKSTPPTDWNDSPEPRRKKPKPQDRPKPKGASDSSKSLRGDPGSKRRTEGPKAVKPRGSSSGPNPGAHAGAGKPKGPPPPKGKSSSKKNRARAQAKGGSSKPRRPKT
ncbi:MAG: DEAD/DEAH box helicase [Paracoccaceae bacterium]